MNLYCLLRNFLPRTLADIIYALLCTLAIILIYMCWPDITNLFVYMML